MRHPAKLRNVPGPAISAKTAAAAKAEIAAARSSRDRSRAHSHRPGALALAAFAGWWVNFHVLNGFFYVAKVVAITVPCATVIMLVDHFLLPRLFAISRPLTRVPAWNDAGRMRPTSSHSRRGP